MKSDPRLTWDPRPGERLQALLEQWHKRECDFVREACARAGLPVCFADEIVTLPGSFSRKLDRLAAECRQRGIQGVPYFSPALSK